MRSRHNFTGPIVAARCRLTCSAFTDQRRGLFLCVPTSLSECLHQNIVVLVTHSQPCGLASARGVDRAVGRAGSFPDREIRGAETLALCRPAKHETFYGVQNHPTTADLPA